MNVDNIGIETKLKIYAPNMLFRKKCNRKFRDDQMIDVTTPFITKQQL